MTVRVRIAPSPTGYLHVGNVRTALVNWLFARKHGGEFRLRLDDTDQERSKPEYEAAIAEDLKWLGLEWDGFAKQSDRYGAYAKAAETLKATGRLYACYETQEELDIKRRMLVSRGKPPIYDRGALQLADDEKKSFAAQGRKPHWRFLLNDKPIAWNDLVRGDTTFQPGHISDPVLIREDGIPLYTFASVVDDGEGGITHIIRGEDHVTNTAVQMQIFEAMGFKRPQFAHLALLRTKEGELSKRTGGHDIRGLRDAGIEPMAINSYLAKIGTSDAVEAFSSMQALIDGFDINKFGRAPANYDEDELKRLNAKILSHYSFEQVNPALSALGISKLNVRFWEAVRGNIHSLVEAKHWWELIHAPVTPVIQDDGFTSQAAGLLPPEPWDGQTWKNWTDAVKQQTGRKGKELFMPLRLALTAREDGPELKLLLPLIGRERAEKRLRGEAA